MRSLLSCFVARGSTLVDRRVLRWFGSDLPFAAGAAIRGNADEDERETADFRCRLGRASRAMFDRDFIAGQREAQPVASTP
jgi:hypothetical protein